MAERLKTPTQEAKVISEADFKKLLRRLTNLEAEVSEAKGGMGGAIASAVERHNLHADALRVFRKYARKNPAQAAEFFLHLQVYWDYGKLGQPEKDLVETPTERRRRMAKPEIEAEAIEGEGDGRSRVVRLKEAAE